MRALRHQVELCHIDDIAKHPPGTSRRYKVAFAFVGARHIVPKGHVSPCPQTRIAFEILEKEIIVYRLFLRNNAHLWPFSSSNPHLWGYHKGNFPIERSSRNLFGSPATVYISTRRVQQLLCLSPIRNSLERPVVKASMIPLWDNAAPQRHGSSSWTKYG